MLVLRKAYLIRIYPEVYLVFKRLRDATGYVRLNEAVEGLMLKCIDAGPVGLPPISEGYERSWVMPYERLCQDYLQEEYFSRAFR